MPSMLHFHLEALDWIPKCSFNQASSHYLRVDIVTDCVMETDGLVNLSIEVTLSNPGSSFSGFPFETLFQSVLDQPARTFKSRGLCLWRIPILCATSIS